MGGGEKGKSQGLPPLKLLNNVDRQFYTMAGTHHCYRYQKVSSMSVDGRECLQEDMAIGGNPDGPGGVVSLQVELPVVLSTIRILNQVNHIMSVDYQMNKILKDFIRSTAKPATIMNGSVFLWYLYASATGEHLCIRFTKELIETACVHFTQGQRT